MRYVVVGAGALGGVIGAKLHIAGYNVALVARGPHLESLQLDGLRLRSPEQDLTARVPAFGSVEAVQPHICSDDVVVLCVKVHQAPPVLSELAALTAGDAPALVCCTNGLDAERQALRHFPRTYAMLPCMLATHLSPGEVELYGRSDPPHRCAWLPLGCYPTGEDALSVRVASDLTSAGFRSESDPVVMQKKRAKMVTNLGNATAALSDAGSEAGQSLVAAARAECLSVYTAAGLRVAKTGPLMKEWVTLIGGPPDSISIHGGRKKYIGSSWQSLTRGTGDIECSYLNGEVCLLGRLHGVDTPANAALQIAATQAARAGAPANAYIKSAELLALAKL